MRRPGAAVTAVAVMGVVAGPAEAVSINSPVGLTPAKGQTIVRVQMRYKRISDDPSSASRDTRVLTVPTTFVYGWSARFAGIVTIPYVYKRRRADGDSGKTVRTTSGLGDATFLGKYRAATRDAPGATARLSILGGVVIPTGRSGDADALGKLPRTLQAGSGAWTPTLGAAYTIQTLDDEWDFNGMYRFPTEAHDFQWGDRWAYTIAYQKRVWPWRLPDEGVYTQFNLVLELNGEWSRKNRDASGSLPDSGGWILYLSPGLQAASQRFVVEASFQMPVDQAWNGSQVDTDYVAVTSLRVTF